MDKMYAKPQYKCAICGEIYDDVRTRMVCESKCLKKQEEEAKKAAEAKKIEEQPARKAEVDKARETYVKLYNEYINDYGEYAYETCTPVTNILVNKYPSLMDIYDFISL